MASFYESEPPPVRAVIELAALRDECRVWGEQGTDERHDLILDQLFPAHADTIRDIAEQLYWIDRLGWDNPVTALHAFYGHWRGGLYPDQAADELSARLQAGAVTSAQLIASVRAVAAA